ncbi:hypothetical protein CC1G_00385 [Coprinopsis cinerea okayama7|uniref:Gfd2/YDR514C-like C-terminal domain-containing protein n=1 Tax=Coprinopsis cinerea (strain Okayama-7 / 130 / ATCC MYA-4618 / FGSC 9003) TaxID=240176 RepID=A8NXS0_COPC7|nr:hypothetical protein CC1G_00385 [Coprinopsis cinerea okayama7\|eukprot:XP_001837249.2 hypothetical protein CC1G_00385 [Coprinopsis cinerea okayama7\
MKALTGYYRYTDIWFDWPSTLPNPEDTDAVKAILAHDALVHPDHPLHVEGVDGAQLYIGTFESGEARLLFSSAQVDYIRYWLHAIGMTKEIIPLPYSDCLLTTTDLKTVTTITFADGFAVRNGLKMVNNNNKKLKGSHFNQTLKYRRSAFERVQGLWSAQKGVWCAIDFEAWERDHTLLTEFGWRLVGWKDGNKVEDHGHLVVNGSHRNGQYVPDNRDGYRFGESQRLSRKEFKQRICDFVKDLRDTYGRVFLIFHDAGQDIKYLNDVGAPLDNILYMLPEPMPEEGVFVIDTSELFAGLMGEDGGNRRSLEKTCRLLQQDAVLLHNAGNDAWWTLACLMEMAGGEVLDVQRERRWPNQTASGSVWVKVQPGQETSDDEDEDVGDEPPKLGYDPTTGKWYRTDMDMDSDDDMEM